MINARNKGKAYELAIIKELKSLYGTDEIYSTRFANQKLDGEKVDIVSEHVPFNIQCKRTENIPQVHKILDEINRDKSPLIFWKKSHKSSIVMMEAETFYDLILAILNNKD